MSPITTFQLFLMWNGIIKTANVQNGLDVKVKLFSRFNDIFMSYLQIDLLMESA